MYETLRFLIIALAMSTCTFGCEVPGAHEVTDDDADDDDADDDDADDDDAADDDDVESYEVTRFHEPDAWRSGLDDSARDLGGYEPDEPGTYPVFVWTAGTGCDWWETSGRYITEHMATRGFVAVSVDYNNVEYTYTCGEVNAKTASVFDSDEQDSAISVICAREKADCGKGIVTAGYSQGAHLANRAADHNEDVRATLPLGNGIAVDQWQDLTPCLGIENTAITSDRIRSIVGETDEHFGVSPDGLGNGHPGVREQQEITTGASCGDDAFDCIGEDGSGWYIVQAHETGWGYGGHGFFLSKTIPGFDPNFEEGTDPWCLGPSLDWLAGFAD